MNMHVVWFGWGFLGGVARGTLGLYKYWNNKKDIELKRLLLTSLCACVIGGFTGMLVDHNPVTSFASGYAGIDILEGIVLAHKKK